MLAVFGLGLALVGARVPRPAEPSDATVLWVNERPITKAQLVYAEKRLAAGSSEVLREADRRSVTDLLIDEELLLQRAESLGVLKADPGIRKTIAQAA
ncbi:MAG: hypothetical protein ACR2PZ_08855, partial [Pseudomonadales bacterium]